MQQQMPKARTTWQQINFTRSSESTSVVRDVRKGKAGRFTALTLRLADLGETTLLLPRLDRLQHSSCQLSRYMHKDCTFLSSFECLRLTSDGLQLLQMCNCHRARISHAHEA